MENNHPIDLLPAFALGCLDSEEYPRVKEHLCVCADCRAELRNLEAISTQLAYAVPAVEPTPSVRDCLLENCRRQKSLSWFEGLFTRWPRLVPATALSACILAVVFATSSLVLWQSTGRRQMDSFSELRLVPLQGTENMPQAVGQLVVDPASGQGRLLASALQPLTKSLQYQLWLIRDGQRTNGGVFSVAADGNVNLLVSSVVPLSHYDNIGITIEPFGGSPRPTGQKVLGGRMVL